VAEERGQKKEAQVTLGPKNHLWISVSRILSVHVNRCISRAEVVIPLGYDFHRTSCNQPGNLTAGGSYLPTSFDKDRGVTLFDLAPRRVWLFSLRRLP
jgi:hypothetical protein